MISVYSIETILSIVKQVKDHKRGYLTNFFMDVARMERWIKLDLVVYEELGETAFICRKNQDFYNLFFITTDIPVLSRDIDLFFNKYSNELFVIDIIGKARDVLNIKTILVRNGFFQYTSLVRMSKVNQENYPEEANFKYLSYADKPKGLEVHWLLQKYFDPYAEQLPLIEEIYIWTSKNGIIIYSDDNQTIQGFLIFELIGQTSYLRYWFVHPDHRGKKIGSTLLHSFFADGRDAKRQLFWVIESNDNAIKRYEHFGFKKEELFDYILINKNIVYEG
jgi:ribosomal protein S18 acetylase RimI-like enzyme